MTACGLGSCWHASQAVAEASTLHSATWDATRHLLSGVRRGQWIMQPPPSLRRRSGRSPRVVLGFHSRNPTVPSRMTRSKCCCNRCWNFLAVVRLVAPIRRCLACYRRILMGCANRMDWSPMAVNRNCCRMRYLSCCRMHCLTGDDLLSSYNSDHRWCYTMADRYLDLRFGSPIRYGWSIR